MVAWQCQGLGPALTPLTTSGMALECPLVSRPRHASCDLVTRALMDNSCPCSVRCPLFSTRPGAPSVSPKLRAIMGSPQILRMNLSMDSMTAQGSGLRGV